MSNAETQIVNLVYRYAELMDEGDFQAAAELFRHARINTQNGVKDYRQLLAQWRSVVKIYACGTPRTRHLVTNPIVEVDEKANTASCRSYYTVLQSLDAFPLQAIAAGRYHDEFFYEDGQWRFSYRDYSLLDLQGDLSQHLNISVP